MAVEDTEVNVREFIQAQRMPRRVFRQLPRAGHEEALTYLGYVDESAFYDFIAERLDGKFVRVEGSSVWEALAAKYAGDDGRISNNCCSGDAGYVKMEFHVFYSRLPRISLVKDD